MIVKKERGSCYPIVLEKHVVIDSASPLEE